MKAKQQQTNVQEDKIIERRTKSKQLHEKINQKMEKRGAEDGRIEDISKLLYILY